jgi:fatty acid desaturase
MNYHIEHHMFAGVPCDNLRKLHEIIAFDLPYCPVGLVATWREIWPILRRQHSDPTYQFVVELPSQQTA